MPPRRNSEERNATAREDRLLQELRSLLEERESEEQDLHDTLELLRQLLSAALEIEPESEAGAEEDDEAAATAEPRRAVRAPKKRVPQTIGFADADAEAEEAVAEDAYPEPAQERELDADESDAAPGESATDLVSDAAWADRGPSRVAELEQDSPPPPEREIEA